MTTKTTTETKQPFDFRTIKLPEDAFKKQGMDPAVMPDLSKLPERFSFITAVFILSVIIEAMNDGWQPDFSDHSQRKYYMWPSVSSSGLDFSISYYDYGNAHASVGFPLYVKSPEIAIYILKQFPQLCKHWLLNVNPE